MTPTRAATLSGEYRTRVMAESCGWIVPSMAPHSLWGVIELIGSSALYVRFDGSPFGSRRWADSPSGMTVSFHPTNLGIPRSPTSVHVPAWDAVVARVDVGDTVTLRHGVVTFRSGPDPVVECLLADAEIWGPPERSQGPRSAHAWDWENPVEVALLLSGTESYASDVQQARSRLGDRLEDLVVALGRGASRPVDSGPNEIDAAVTALVGFGPGLTPSGDDVLVGCILGLMRWGGPEAIVDDMRESILKRLCFVDATTFVSGQMLSLGCAGHTHEALENVFVAVARRDRCAVAATLARLLDVGATSGADTTLGLLSALAVKALLESRAFAARHAEPHPTSTDRTDDEDGSP